MRYSRRAVGIATGWLLGSWSASIVLLTVNPCVDSLSLSPSLPLSKNIDGGEPCFQEVVSIDANFAKIISAPEFSHLRTSISYSHSYLKTFGVDTLFSVNKVMLMGNTTVGEIETAFLGRDLQNIFTALDAAQNEKEAFF